MPRLVSLKQMWDRSGQQVCVFCGCSDAQGMVRACQVLVGLLALRKYIQRQIMTHPRLDMALLCSCADQRHGRGDCMLANDLDQGYQLIRAAFNNNGAIP